MAHDLEITIEGIEQIRGILASPQIKIKFKILNKLKDIDFIFENINYDLKIITGISTINCGTNFLFARPKIDYKEYAILESNVKWNYSIIMAINSNALSKHDVFFKIKILNGTFYVNNQLKYVPPSEINLTIPQSDWNQWYRNWMDEYYNLKLLIGEEIASSTANEIGIAFAERFKKDLEMFLSSELTSTKQFLNNYSKIIDLIEYTKIKIGSFINESWALAVLSTSLLENLINLKLDELGEDTKGSFTDRVSKLSEKIKEIDGKSISSLSIEMRENYTARTIISHASHKNQIDQTLAGKYLRFIKKVIENLWG